jgi:hypothetical protein
LRAAFIETPPHVKVVNWWIIIAVNEDGIQQIKYR